MMIRSSVYLNDFLNKPGYRLETPLGDRRFECLEKDAVVRLR